MAGLGCTHSWKTPQTLPACYTTGKGWESEHTKLEHPTYSRMPWAASMCAVEWGRPGHEPSHLKVSKGCSSLQAKKLSDEA